MTPVSNRIPPRADNKYTHQGIDLPLLPLRSGLAVKTICGKKNRIQLTWKKNIETKGRRGVLCFTVYNCKLRSINGWKRNNGRKVEMMHEMQTIWQMQYVVIRVEIQVQFEKKQRQKQKKQEHLTVAMSFSSFLCVTLVGGWTCASVSNSTTKGSSSC